MTENIGLKIGSRTLVCKTSEAITSFDSCIAPERDLSGKIHNYVIGKPEHDNVMYPLERGIIKNEEEATLLKEILRFTKLPRHSNIVLATPETELVEGRELLIKAVSEALNPIEIIPYPESFCGAVTYLGVDTAINSFFTALNLGSTTTGIGIYSSCDKLLLTSTPTVSGTTVDASIMQHLINVFGKPVTNLNSIRKLKENFNFATPSLLTPIDIRISGAQKTANCSPQITSSLEQYTLSVSDIFIRAFASLPPESAYNMLSRPLIFSGGMSNIPGLCARIVHHINDKANAEIPLHIVKEGHIAPAIGAHMLALESF